MIKEKLNKILGIKEEIKTSLINSGISGISDNFEEYAELIRSLKPYDIYASYFELVPDEYIEKEEDGFIVKYEKYRYMYSDDIFVEGEEISREELMLTIDAQTTDGSEIIINYSGGTISTENGKLYGKYSGDFISVQNLDKAVNLYINTDNLPGEALDYKVAGSGSTDNNNIVKIDLICRNAENLAGFAKTCSALNTFNIYASEKLKSIEQLCQRSKGVTIKELNVYDAYNLSDVYQACHANSSVNSGEQMTICLSNIDYIAGFLCRFGFNKIFLYGGPFSDHIKSKTSYTAWDAWNYSGYSYIKEIYGLDVSKISDDTEFELFTNKNNSQNNNALANLNKCKVDGLGVSTQNINSKVYPYSSNWDEEDIIYSFSNIAPTENPEAAVYCSSRVKTIFQNYPDLVATITERGYSVIYS